MSAHIDNSFSENENDSWAKYFRTAVPIAGTVIGAFSGQAGALIGGIVGPILGEFLASTLPNQRIDRIATYLGIFRHKYSDDKIEEFLKIPEKVSLLEEGLYAAGFTPHKDRLLRISNFVASGISKDNFELDKESNLLSIVKNISDVDFIILNYFKIRDDHNEEKIAQYENMHPYIFPDKIITNENSKNQYEIKFNLEGRKRYISSLGLIFVLPTNISRPNPQSVGRNNPEDFYKYQLDILSDQLKALQEPRYGISFLGEEVLERMISD